MNDKYTNTADRVPMNEKFLKRTTLLSTFGEGARGLQPAPAAALVAGTAAMRNTKRGSWYVEALTQVFSERACDMHVADMLVKVSGLRPAAQCSTLLLPCTGFQSSTTLPLVLDNNAGSS